MKKLIAASLLLLMVFGSTGCSQSCAEQTVEYREQVDDVLSEWEDSVEVALSTARLALPAQITNLQEIKREAEDLETPECATKAQERLVNYMDKTIDALLTFMADSEADLDDEFTAVINSRTNFDNAYAGLTEDE